MIYIIIDITNSNKMGNKAFDKVQYKTLLTEANSRMTIRRGKKVNELYKQRDKIVNYVKNGDMASALIYIDNYINEESKLKVYDVLCTMCDQMKGRVAEVESYGITDDLATNANAIVYASHRLDVKELEKLSSLLKEVMPKVEFKEAMNGTCHNEIVRDHISYRKCEKGESYLKLIEICKETDTQCILKEEWKKVLREYCYKNQIDYPYSAEEDLGYNPGVDSVPQPMPIPSYGGGYGPPAGGYGPAPGGYAPAPQYYSPGPGVYGGGMMPGAHVATPIDYSSPDNLPPPATGGYIDPYSGYSSSGFSLPPAPTELNLPKYGVEEKKPAAPAKKPKAPEPKPVEKEDKQDDDDSDDEDLMARLRNLQK